MSALSKLRKSLKEQTSVCIVESGRDGSYYRGIVTHISSVFVALHQIENLEFNGTVILALKDFNDVRDGTFSKVTDRILEQNREIKKQRPAAWLNDCETWQDLFLNLKRRRIWPSLEVVKKKDCWFLIGPILDVEEKGSYIHNFSGDGKWQKEPDPITYKYLHQVMFGDRYSKHFNRYMRTKGLPD